MVEIKSILPKFKVFLTLILLATLCLSINDVAYSKRRRRKAYNKTKTKAAALAKLRNSEKLSELAGLEAKAAKTGSEAYIELNIDTINNNNKSDVLLLQSSMATVNSEGEEGENIAELEAEDDVEVNLSDFRSIWLLAMGGSDSEYETTSFGANKEELMSVIMNWLGTPYRFGGDSKKAIDCSAWTRRVFRESCDISLPRTARTQVRVGQRIKRNQLKFGDLIFFHTYSRKFASHVGIYLGDNLFAHASSAKGVTISSLESTYYKRRFIGGRRLRTLDIEHYKIASAGNSKKNL